MTWEEERKLGLLKARAEGLDLAIKAYLRALVAAREVGASWAQMGQAASLSKGGARGQHRVAQLGGEMHIKIDPISVKEGS